MKMITNVIDEYKKVKWPKKEEVVDATAVVAIMTTLLVGFLGLFNVVIGRLLDLLASVVGG